MNKFNNINNNQFQQRKQIQPIINNSNNIINNVKEPKKEQIYLLFEAKPGIPISVCCYSDDKLSIVFNKYKLKIGFPDEKDDLKYICEGSILNPSESVEEANLRNLSRVIVVGFGDVIGG